MAKGKGYFVAIIESNRFFFQSNSFILESLAPYIITHPFMTQFKSLPAMKSHLVFSPF
jgi:hypothetical protein